MLRLGSAMGRRAQDASTGEVMLRSQFVGNFRDKRTTLTSSRACLGKDGRCQ